VAAWVIRNLKNGVLRDKPGVVFSVDDHQVSFIVVAEKLPDATIGIVREDDVASVDSRNVWVFALARIFTGQTESALAVDISTRRWVGCQPRPLQVESPDRFEEPRHMP
jgi:hypothetical protein